MATPPAEIRANARAALAAILLLNVIDLLPLDTFNARRAGTTFYQGKLVDRI
jgi:hypothetical protein